MSQDVTFKLNGKASNLKIDFRLEDSRIKKDKPISTGDIKIEGGTGKLTIKVDVSRHGNSDVADWYNAFVNGETLHMMHAESGGNKPEELNLALKGWLIIDGVEYHVCFGQGHYTFTNNWHFCSYDLLARQNNKSGYLDNIYYMDTSGSDEFDIKFADEINSGKGVELWAYTGGSPVVPRFDMEGDTLHPFPYKSSNLGGTGTMQRGKAFDTTGTFPEHRDFHIQAISSSGSQLTEVKYKIDRITGGISGNTVAQQTVVQFTDSQGTAWLMNYGISHAPPPITDQSYNYLGKRNLNWLGDLAAACPGIRFNQLVLPGAHDAGMYEINVDGLPWIAQAAAALLALLIPVPVCSTYLAATLAANGFTVALENFSVTQKDTAYDQMISGTRYFDFRPGYAKDGDEKQTYHIHNFIPGAPFATFLRDVSKFLEENPKEIAVFRITSSGIDEDKFTPLTQSQVEDFAKANISAQVGYEFPSDLSAFEAQTLESIAASGKRVIFLYHIGGVNDSYSDSVYSTSLTDPGAVIGALNETVANTSSSYNLTMLQLQNTGSAALQHYIGNIAGDCTAWINDLVGSKTGNILQDTKAIFDHATYTWLTQSDVIADIQKQDPLVVVQNDFVDVALAEHAAALCKERFDAK